jgi:hypothetical protein
MVSTAPAIGHDGVAVAIPLLLRSYRTIAARLFGME